MRALLLFPLIVAVSMDASAAGTVHVQGFPIAGTYDVNQEHGGKRQQFSQRLDASNPEDFQRQFIDKPRSRCRDRQVSISNGSFRFAETCDAPDGDIHNIRKVVVGHFSNEAISLSMEMTFWQQTIRTTQNYRLRRP